MAAALFSIAIGIGGYLLQGLFAPKQKDIVGGRLSDINVPAVSPGNPITKVWGTMKVGVQLVWTSRLIETKHSEKVGGGKGGVGPKAQKSITYTYSVDCAVGVCEGPIYRFRRIRANQKLLWVNNEIKDELVDDFTTAYYSEGTRLLDLEVDYEEAHVGAFFFAFNNYRLDEFVPKSKAETLTFIEEHPLSPPTDPDMAQVDDLLTKMFSDMDKDLNYEKTKIRYDDIIMYLGYEGQLPSSIIEGYRGVGNVSGFRGTAHFVISNLQLEDFGNAIPQFQAEVQKTDGSVALIDIISDLCVGAGLDEDQFSVASNIPGITVAGFAVTSVTSARTVLQDLQKVYPFDGQETSYILNFGWTERRPQALIRREDFNARLADEASGSPEEITRIFDYDLPKRINFSYQEPARNYSLNTVSAFRTETESNTVEDIAAALAMSREEAKSRVEEALANRYKARRIYKVRLLRKYVILEPGDVVLVPFKEYADRYYPLQLIEIAIGANGIIEAQFIDHHSKSYMVASVEEDQEIFDDESEAANARTRAYMPDIPLITDTEEDNVGYYAVIAGARNGWTGGALIVDMAAGGVVSAFGSDDAPTTSGSNWYTLADNNTQTPHGYTLGVLGDVDAPFLRDRVNRLRVLVLNSNVTLTSYTEDDLLLQPLNLALVGVELVQYANVTDMGNGVWELSTFLRGLRGTEVQTGSHERGERFLRLKSGVVDRVEHDSTYLDVVGTYKVISFGQPVDEVSSFLFTNAGNSLRPYAPQIIDAYKTDTPDVVLSWIPRLRQRDGWFPDANTVIDQPFEKYEIDVCGITGLTLHRTVALTDLTTWTYTSAMRTVDSVATGDTLLFQVYQIGQIIGRGFAAEVRV